MTKNYVLKPIYNYENECINDTLSLYLETNPLKLFWNQVIEISHFLKFYGCKDIVKHLEEHIDKF